MKVLFKWYLLCLLAVLHVSVVQAGLNFGSKESAINLVGGKLVMSNAIQNWDGTLSTSSAHNVTSGHITFNGGRLNINNVPAAFSGRLQAAVAQQVQLLGSQSMRIESGPFPARLYVSGSENRFEGQPIFSDDTTINPNITIDVGSQLILALQNMCRGFISLSNSSLILDDHLMMGDGKEIIGVGSIDGNKKSLAFGGTDMAMTGTLRFFGPTQLIFNANTRLGSTWTIGSTDLSKQVAITGNGNILDLSLGGTLAISPGVSVALSNIKIKGLGRGHIAFGSPSSQLRLSDVQLELDDHYTVTVGNMYVDGPSTIVCKNKLLTFSNKGSLSVDGVTLWYDAVGYDDQKNIRPLRPFATNDANSNFGLLNGGTIRAITTAPSGNITITGPEDHLAVKTLGDDLALTPSKAIILHQNTAINGDGFALSFNNDDGLIALAPNKNVNFKNVTLSDFSPQHVTNGNGQTVSFGDNVVINLAPTKADIAYGAIKLNNEWIFGGKTNMLVDGGGNTLDISSNINALTLISTGTLTLQNMKIYGAGGLPRFGNIRCLNRLGTINLKNVELILTDDFTQLRGFMNILPDVVMRGVGKKFTYRSEFPLTITDNAMLTLDYGLTFSYDSRDHSDTSNQHFKFATDASALTLNGANLHATTVGLKIQQGTIFIDNIVRFTSDSDELHKGFEVASRVNLHVLLRGALAIRGNVTLE